ncbi:hypothetical protein M3147_12865 [Agromyces mediolanus]|uniref:hypothetical protein n=1 Tax=Agromyces mediolanus TaxID=41986 RepID=UPI00203CBBB9|nr:hypothetical protein [Agromyces mediolanus]MCM3658141.1 hypothetical protein [Agromyces mediolanus]
MLAFEPREPDELLFSRHADAGTTSSRTLERDASDGRIHRIRPGVFGARTAWAEASDRRRAILRTAAVVGTRRDRAVLSHESAALLWGLPRLGRWPEAVELADARGTTPRSRNGVVWRRTRFDPDEVVEIDGFLVTGLGQTLIDIARTRDFVGAVVALDAGVSTFLWNDDRVVARGAGRGALLHRLDRVGSARGVRGARRAVAFADGRSESPGESLSRARMHELGFPPPRLQVEFPRDSGGFDRVDFDWPEFGLFGEFDGDAKYLDARMRAGRPIERVILAEKKRAERITRRWGRREVRWDWRTAWSPDRLRRCLLEAGLPIVRADGVGSRPR